MRIITLNANGIRSASRKGLFDWMAQQNTDILCIQETKAHRQQLVEPHFWPISHHGYYHDAEKKGYSGVAIYTRQKPDTVIEGLGWPDMDAEGRYLELRFGRLSIVSLYIPSGSSSEQRQSVKFDFLERFLPHLRECASSERDYIFCGDWNIAHKPIDLKNWKSNQKNSGFLPEERSWLDTVLITDGWIDAFRALYPEVTEYTWWSNRGQAWANNVGWRIDYQVVSPSLRAALISGSIYRDNRFSDHAPLTIDYDYPFPA
jgi:exodeoxyribonuclease-3